MRFDTLQELLVVILPPFWVSLEAFARLVRPCCDMKKFDLIGIPGPPNVTTTLKFTSKFTGGQSTYSPLFILARLLESGNESYYKMTRLDEDESKRIITMAKE